MPKTIVPKTEIANDPKLSIIKAFRLATKHIGELKTAIANTEVEDDIQTFTGNLTVLRVRKRALALLAQDQGFHLWTDDSGKTGHTYEKDYKETPDEVNDWGAFQSRHNPVNVETPGVLSITEAIAQQTGEPIETEAEVENAEQDEDGEYRSGEE
jgi:hypothetical protein